MLDFPKALLVLALLPALASARPDSLAHTFSILARDPATGQIGVAVQSHWPGVGAMVSWAQAGVGAVATQSFVRARYGPDCLALLAKGASPEEAFRRASRGDPGREGRQVGVLDRAGRVFAFTGKENIPVAHHLLGEGFVVQANLMLDDRVVPAIAEAFLSAQGSLAERLIAALRAGQRAGGDVRGKQSASLLVVSGEAHGDPERDKLVDLRVDDHREPVEELARLLALRQAYDRGNQIQAMIQQGQVEAAEAAWKKLEEGCPDCHEPRFWVAVALLKRGMVGPAQMHFQQLLNVDPAWGETLRRLPMAGLLPMEAVLQAAPKDPGS